MASTSGFNPEPQSENQHSNASERIGSSPSTFVTSLVGSLFISCFDWCSHLCSMISVACNSVLSTSTNTQPAENEVASAFDGIQRFSSIPGTSSVPKQILPYDVFINHYGPDAKSTLATRLYNILSDMGLRVFLDEIKEFDLEVSLAVEIEEAMRSASIHIPILSKNYAQSSRCLSELSFIFKTGAKIIPVYYHVQPSYLRYAKGFYAKAFSQHGKKGRYTPEKLQEWKDALNNVCFYRGLIVVDNEDELSLLKNIVNIVLKETNAVIPLMVAKHPVGLEEIVADFGMTTLQSTESHRHVQIVGIWGMGGSGKTTLAIEVYNNKSGLMEKSSFIFDITEGSLHSRQNLLIRGLGLRGISVENVEEGKKILASGLRSVRALIVLDDVDHVDQLDALIPEKASLGSGSLIVVTTRRLDVLQSWGISSIYQMQALSDTHAKQLFCWHAFLQPYPVSGFEDLVEKFLRASQGLPLSLKVFGSQLHGESDKNYWKALLDQISRILPGDIKGRLKVSYDALDDEEKEVYLDIACFLVGEKKSLAIAIWNGCNWPGLKRLESLMDKGLVELDQQSRLRMQGQLRDLGKEIADTNLPHRLWSSRQNEIPLLNQHAEETPQIRGIMAAITQFSSCSAHHEFPSYSSSYQPPLKEYLNIIQSSISRSFPGRPLSLGLKLLVITGDDFNSEFAKLSQDLVWLRWFDFKHTTLPSWESLRNLRILELYGATILKELWQDAKPPPFKQLTELNITCSWGSSLQSFPRSISNLKRLKKIALIGYLGDEFPIKRLPEEFCNLNKLEHLELRHCRVLTSLPSRFGQLRMLRHLDLCSCVELRMLPVSFNQLTCLEYLDLSGCRKLTFRLDFLKNISKLEKLDFTGCRRLQELPREIGSQTYLRQVSMRDTRLRNMPSNVDQLRKLSTLQIGSPFLRSLPHSLGVLSSLSHLTIFDCPNLESLPDSVGCLCRLQYLCIESSGLKCLPDSFGQLACLEVFEISGCPIRELDLGKEFSSPFCLGSLKLLRIVDTQLSRLSISDDCCPVLKALQLMQNEVLEEIVTLPTSLEEIKLWECERLEDITCIQNLPNLKYIDK